MVRSTHNRVGEYFNKYTKELRKQTKANNSTVTDSLAHFLEDEKLTPLLIKRAKENQLQRKRGLFR